MTIQQIQYLLTIVRTGSLNRAAEQLYVSQPTLTGVVKSLEEELGITLFNRTNRGVTLTPEGTDFLTYARSLYSQYEIIAEKYGDASKLKRKFGVSSQHYSFAVEAFVNLVRHYDTAQFDFALRETRTHDVLTDVGSQISEIGILYRSDNNSSFLNKYLRDYGLDFHPLVSCDAYVHLWKGHPLANEPSLSLAQLEPYPCLSFEQGDMSALFFNEEILTDISYARTIRTNDRATMLNLMVGLNGFTLCSGIISQVMSGSEFCVIPFREDEENRNTRMEIGYVTKHRSLLSSIGREYIGELTRVLEHCKPSPKPSPDVAQL